MKATIEISEYNSNALTLTDYNNKIIGWDDLSKKEQLNLLESCKDFIDYFTPHVKQ